MATFLDLTASLGQKIRHENLRLIGQTTDYNPGIDGREQVLYTENRVWRGSIVFPTMVGRDLALLRSVPTRLRGRAGVMRLPLMNIASPRFEGDKVAFWQSVGVPQADIDQGAAAFADGANFADGSGFALPDADDEFLTDPQAIGDTTIKLTGYIGRNLQVGDRFSILARLYEVEENQDGQITFSPPARKDAPAGTLVRVSEPHIDVRLAGNEDWEVVINLGHHSEALTVNVVEAFDR
ncbi:hypothetical protein [Shimia ponticola]|uniref:hypothetical protein n=1 Tax=Shimia ponticola TaxID=2582893 RepID=UPI0011BF2390|nr:hypothetical protein [Shimia ponticola]